MSGERVLFWWGATVFLVVFVSWGWFRESGEVGSHGPERLVEEVSEASSVCRYQDERPYACGGCAAEGEDEVRRDCDERQGEHGESPVCSARVLVSGAERSSEGGVEDDRECEDGEDLRRC